MLSVYFNMFFSQLTPVRFKILHIYCHRLVITPYYISHNTLRRRALFLLHWRTELDPALIDKFLYQFYLITDHCGPYYRLSGESPFQGSSDAETFALVTAAHYTFDEESFEDISDQAKDFISSLLKKDRRSDCLPFLHWGKMFLCFVCFSIAATVDYLWDCQTFDIFLKTFLHTW